MADYMTTTIVREPIPAADVTPLELFLLSEVFDAVADGDAWHFSDTEGPVYYVTVTREKLEALLAESKSATSGANELVAEQLAKFDPAATRIELDLLESGWEFIFQDIVRRSQRLRYVSIVAAFTCSKMRHDGFGGGAWLITADKIWVKSTADLIADFLGEAGLADGPDRIAKPGTEG